MTAPSATHTVERKLRKAWRKERRYYHGDGIAHLLVWLLALILLDLLIDWLFLLPGAGRLLLLGINIVALGWVLWHYWLRHLRPYDPVRVALQVERRHPELQSMLVSFVQLTGDAPETAFASPALLRVLRNQTVEITRPIDFREIISYKELKRIALLSAAVIAFFALYSVNWGEHLRVLLNRMINPSAETGYPTATTIDFVTGDATLQQGKSITIAARAGGRIPARGVLVVVPKGGADDTIALFPGGDEGDEFAYRFREVYQPFEYYIRLGDARSDDFTIGVVPPPRIVKTVVSLRYPAYTKQDAKTVDFLNLEVPEGTIVDWELHCDRPLASAEMLRDETDASPMVLNATGTIARISRTATESFAYQFRWKEREHGYAYDDEIHYFVQVIPDSPPQVEVLFPTADDKATTRKTLTVSYLARDDYGVAQAWIVYQVNEGEEKRRPIGDFDATLVEEQAAWKLAAADSIPDLKEGDVVTFALEVADTHGGDDGPQVARSTSRRLFIVSVEDYLRYILEKRRRLRTEIEGMRTQEREADTEVGKLKDETPEPPPP